MAKKAEQQLSEEELAEISVRCLSFELHGLSLLLPNTLVAEVTEATPDVTAAGNSPEWLRGFVSWRGRNVPLVSFEKILGIESDVHHGESRMVVLNTLNNNSRVPFMAIEIQGLPRLSLLKHGMLEYDDNNNTEEPVVYSALRIDGESMIVPDIDAIEKMLENLGIFT